MFADLPPGVQDRARKAFRLFRNNPAHPSLSFERLLFHPDVWSARITADYRAVCQVVGDTAYWIWVGSHAQFDASFPRRWKTAGVLALS
jgi:hypothetical protein